MIIPNWNAPSNIRAVSTTRIGGVSHDQYSSFNLGDHVGDDPHLVERNRLLLSAELNLPTNPLWLDQVHGVEIVKNSSSLKPNIKAPIRADASWTDEPGRVCAVMTADCLPIVLCTSKGEMIAAIHAGWRSLAAGIIEKTVAQMNVEPDSLLAWLGPHIGLDHFEVGLEVREALGGPHSAYKKHHEAQKVYADLGRIAFDKLLRLGVDQIVSADMCTYANSEQFFSYRRDGQCGRMATLIWICEDNND